MTFPETLEHLEAGKAVGREAWHHDTVIVSLDDETAIMCEQHGSPNKWAPRLSDLLADDWEVRKDASEIDDSAELRF